MTAVLTRRGFAVRMVCVLTLAMVCAMGVVQAVHAHADDSAATSHHACSICSTAHAGLGTEITFAPPVLAEAELDALNKELPGPSRSIEVHFIRPPPAA